MTNVYTTDDVSEHNTEKDLWMTMHGGVYNLTDFLTKHPGGEEVLLNLAGQDGTICFDEIGHTEEAIQLRETLKIGVVTGDSSTVGATKRVKNREPTVDDDDWVYQGGPVKTGPSNLPAVIAIGALVYGVIFYYFFVS